MQWGRSICRCLRRCSLYLADLCFAWQVPRVKADASARVAHALAEAYEAVYQVLMDPQHGYSAAAAQASDVVKHTPLQVRTILGVVT